MCYLSLEYMEYQLYCKSRKVFDFILQERAQCKKKKKKYYCTFSSSALQAVLFRLQTQESRLRLKQVAASVTRFSVCQFQDPFFSSSTGPIATGSRRRRLVLKPSQKDALQALFQQNPPWDSDQRTTGPRARH